MTRNNQWPDLLLQTLQAAGLGQDVRLVRAYGPGRQPYPPSRPCIAVGFEELRLAPGALGGYWGSRDGAPIGGSWAEITLSLRLYVPREEGGEACHALLERVWQALADSGDFPGCSLRAGRVVSDRDSGAFLLEAALQFAEAAGEA